MKATEFCYWLQGFFEIGGTTPLSAEQVEIVQRHLSLVFKHDIDPKAGPPERQKTLQELHDGFKDGKTMRC